MKNAFLHKLHTLDFPHSYSVEGWLNSLTITYDKVNNTITVVFPHMFFAPWFTQNVQFFFEKVIKLIVQEKYNKNPIFIYQNPKKLLTETQFLKNTKIIPPVADFFKDYFYNVKNELPLAAAQEVAKADFPLKYNPFVIYGQSGMGKSHIIRCIQEALCTRTLQKKEFFSGTAKDFCEKIKLIGIEPFVSSYDFFKLLDLHSLELNTEEQQYLINFIEFCVEKNKQLLCTSIISPSLNKKLSASLRLRLEQGLIMELKKSDIDVRMRYITSLKNRENLKLTKEQTLLIAQHCENIGLIRGVILKIKAFQNITQKKLQTIHIENILDSTKGEEKNLQIEDIISLCSQYFNISKEQFYTSQRNPDIVLARQICMFLCRDFLGLSYASLGKSFGGKDHSTVLHSIKKIKLLLLTNKDIQHKVTELKRKCASI